MVPALLGGASRSFHCTVLTPPSHTRPPALPRAPPASPAVLIILMLKFGSSNILWLCLTLQVPVANLVFAISWMPKSTPASPWNILGLVLIMAGLIMVRGVTSAVDDFSVPVWCHSRCARPRALRSPSPHLATHLLQYRFWPVLEAKFVKMGWMKAPKAADDSESLLEDGE